MLALRLEYLTGRAVATAYNDRGGAEWPPHPARVFSALVATWGEQDPREGAPEPEDERVALEWLERQGPPALCCGEASARTVATHFVPTNDVTLLPAALGKLADKVSLLQVELRKAESAVVASGEAGAKARADAVGRARAALKKAEVQYRAACASAFTAAGGSREERARAAALLPDSRGRQGRTFPTLALSDPIVYLCWPAVTDCPHQEALNRLAARLIRIGHSSSLVHARWVGEAPQPDWLPHDNGELLLRVTDTGQFERLRAEFERHQGVDPRVLPFRAQRYRAAADQPAPCDGDTRHFAADDWIVLKRVGGAALPLTRTVEVAAAVRGALMRHSEQPVPEIISGHEEEGTPSRRPHLLVLPLPHVGHRHADGGIRGIVLLLPQALDEERRRPVLRALGRWESQARKESGEPEEDAPTLRLGLRDEVLLEVQRHVWGDPGLAALRPATWCQAALEWLSVTPVALDRNPGDLTHADPTAREAAFAAAAETIAKSCRNVGLPLPQEVTVLPSGTWAGGAKAAQFPAFPPEAGKTRRVRVHARLRFAEAIQGPVVLGAGRYHGLGLFRPVTREDLP